MVSLFILSAAFAGDESPVEVTPYGWVRPGFAWIQDDDLVVTDQDGFVLAARFGLEAAFPKGFSAEIEADLTPEPILRDAAATWRPNDWVSVHAGQFKVPVSVGHLVSDARRLMPEASLLVQEVQGRDVGAAVTLSLPVDGERRAALTSAVMNGEGANKIQNVNQRFLFAQRVVVTPLGGRPMTEGVTEHPFLSIGGSWVYNLVGEGTTAEELNWVVADLQGAYDVVSVQGEFLWGDHYFANATVQDYQVSGFYGQVASFVPVGWAKQHLEVVARAGQHDANSEVTTDTTLQFAPSTLELSGGVNLYARKLPHAIQDLKLQVAYTHYRELEGLDIGNDGLQAQATVRF